MPLPPRLFPGDEELGKRDDDHRPGTGIGLGIKTPLGKVWQHRRMSHGPHRRTMRRLALGALAIIGLYYFFINMPTDLENPRQRPHYSSQGGGAGSGTDLRTPPAAQGSRFKPAHDQDAQEPLHNFNGPIKFYQLASSLHAVANTRGAELINQNVVWPSIRCCDH